MWPNPQFPADLAIFTEEFLVKSFIFCAVGVLSITSSHLIVFGDILRRYAYFVTMQPA